VILEGDDLRDVAVALEFTRKFYVQVHGDGLAETQFVNRVVYLEVTARQEVPK
jgi:hypothetical protein